MATIGTLSRLVAAALIGITLAAMAADASAGGRHGGHYHRGGNVHFSLGLWGPGYWGPGYWGRSYWGPGYWGPGYWGGGYWANPAPLVVIPQEPRVYVERDPAPVNTPAPAAPQQWWYWCSSANGYYPYVSNCAEGWQRVLPQTPQGAQ